VLVCLVVSGLAACAKHPPKQAASTSDASPVSSQATPMDGRRVDPTPVANKPLVARDQPLNAEPLGLELGYANLEGVKQKLGGLTSLQDRGANLYSGGAMLESDGRGLGIDGLSDLLFIFDKNNVLVGVVMTMPKRPQDILGKLSSKYTVVDNGIDTFMDDGYARLEKGNSFVVVDAPLLSFTMEVRYLTKQLMADFERARAEAEKKQQQNETNQL
jgi:hypothetical protein